MNTLTVFLVVVSVWVMSASPNNIDYAGAKKVGTYRGKQAVRDCQRALVAIQAGLGNGEVVLCIPYEHKDKP